MGASAAVFLLAAVFGSQEKGSVISSVVLCVFYLLIFYIFAVVRTNKGRASVRTVFLLVILTELSITTYIGIKTVGTTDRDTYPDRYEQIQTLLDMRRTDNADFYRTDIDYFSIFNNPFLYNYNGISIWSSTVNVDVVGFMAGLGVIGSRSNIDYTDTSPLVNAFLNMRYMISRRGKPIDNSVYWEAAGEAGDLLLLENRHYLPLGFMVNEDITGYKHYDDNPFLSQNDLLRHATGLEGHLFTIIDINALAQKDNERGRTIWSIKIPFDELLYAYCTTDCRELMEISVNGRVIRKDHVFDNEPYIITMGSFSRGDTVSFSLENSNALIYLGFLNSDLFEQGYDLLADEIWTLTKFTDTQVIGNVTALKDGALYTSIPGDKNWSVFVDGVKSEIVLIDNAMAAVRLNKGVHTVEFRYFNKSLLAGIIVSLVSLAVFAALVLMNTLKRRKQSSFGVNE
jgi:uncharacterized membrane protein YfhO